LTALDGVAVWVRMGSTERIRFLWARGDACHKVKEDAASE
jgi:hypothetical protein